MRRDKYFQDANILITDKNMKIGYDGCGHPESMINVLEQAQQMNMMCQSDKVEAISEKLSDKFYLLMGSSNFHHLDVANISRVFKKENNSLQLLLIDRHMDSQTYNTKTKELHCGNWISYVCHQNYVSKVIVVGSDDHRELKSFNKNFIDSDKYGYFPQVSSVNVSEIFDKSEPVYISIDTDVLDVPSDWGTGKQSLEEILNSSFWEDLKNYNIAGACIHGHVTDGRRFRDMFKKAFSDDIYNGNKLSWDEVVESIFHAWLPKLKASLTTRPLPLEQQRDIIWAFYQKIESIRNYSASP